MTEEFGGRCPICGSGAGVAEQGEARVGVGKVVPRPYRMPSNPAARRADAHIWVSW